MKRELLQNTRVIPYASGDVIDRTGFLSAVLGCTASAAGEITVVITHSDDGETFEAVTDKQVFVEKATENGTYKTTAAEAGDIVDIDIDLIGCKNYVKFTVTGASALAVAIGDSSEQPV